MMKLQLLLFSISISLMNVFTPINAQMNTANYENKAVQIESVHFNEDLIQTQLMPLAEKVDTTNKAIEQRYEEKLAEEASLTIEQRIERACDKYDVPYDIALSIARLETGWFKSSAYLNKNNPGGLSRNEKPISFDTIEEGVEAYISNLARNYFAKGLDTPEKIGKKYCPVNPNWARIVNELIAMENNQGGKL